MHTPRLMPMNLPPIPGALGLSRRSAAQWPLLIQQTAAEPDPANFYMRLHYQMLGLGDAELAMDLQRQALQHRTVFRMEGCARPRLRLLVLMGPGGMMDNTPVDFLLDGSDVELTLLYVLPDAPWPDAVPDHDVAFVALASSDRNDRSLHRIGQLLQHWPRPVLNRPERLESCRRDQLGRLLGGVSGLLLPKTWRLCRADLAGWTTLPCTVRPVDTQGGQGLARIGQPHDLQDYLAQHPEAEFYVSEYIDCQGPDGLYRKCRIALIDGRAYACHLAISSHWMVHYYSAPMTEQAALRAEEADFMQGFDDGFGRRHAPALSEIARRMGLDYLVLDCAETQDGRLLVFEADNQSWIHDTDPVSLFPYKPAVMRKAFMAFRRMLFRAAGAFGADGL